MIKLQAGILPACTLSSDQSIIELFIFLLGNTPGQILLHPVFHQLSPMLRLVIEDVFTVIDGINQLFCIIVSEREPVSGSFEFIQGDDRILKSSGLTNNGNRSVAERDDLGQTTRFKQRGNQE